MPKQVETVEKITAVNCPEREHHRQRVGLVCGACSELIPSGGAYSPEQYERYFGTPVVHPSSPWGLTDEEKELWAEYDKVRLTHEEAFFKVVDLERGRMGARKDGTDTRRIEVQIAEEKAHVDELHKAMTALLLELNTRALRRKGLQQEAQWRENGLQAAPSGIAARIADAIRGART
jgi:hypothetical protein